MRNNFGSFLVTTSDERTWPLNESIVFLKEQCLKYDRKHIWGDLNSIVEENPILSVEQRINLMNMVNNFQKILFPIIVQILNEYHKKSFSVNFWQIFIGHWLDMFLNLVLKQKIVLDNVLSSKNIIGANFIKIHDIDLIPKDMSDMIRLHKIESYNSAIDLKIISNLNNTDFTIKEIPINFETENISNITVENQKLSLRGQFFSKILRINHLFVRSHEPYISSTYLPVKEELKLQASFVMTPKYWRKFLVHQVTAHPNLVLRKSLTNKLVINSELDIISNLVFELMPISYLEGFSELYKKVHDSNLPKNPKFIFTSNDFLSYEVFKLYTAICSEKGIKYFVGQHGNNYGTNIFTNPSIEELTSDKFLTWGWTNDNKKHIPSFLFKFARTKSLKSDKKSLLLVQFPLGLNVLESKLNFQPDLYFKNQIKFIKTLDTNLFENIIIRLSSATTNPIHLDAKKFNDYFPELEIDLGETNLLELINKSKLTVFSYDSTGILENLSSNNPTLAFWQHGLEHLNDSAKEDYHILVEAGIIHLSPESIGKKVNEVWDNVELWWESSLVQDARAQFCSKYARISSKPIRDLRRILIKNL